MRSWFIPPLHEDPQENVPCSARENPRRPRGPARPGALRASSRADVNLNGLVEGDHPPPKPGER